VGLGVELRPAFRALTSEAGIAVDRHGVVHHGLDFAGVLLGSFHRNHRTPATDGLGVVVRVVLAETGIGERADQSTSCRTRDRASAGSIGLTRG